MSLPRHVSSGQARAMFICLEGNACKDGSSARRLRSDGKLALDQMHFFSHAGQAQALSTRGTSLVKANAAVPSSFTVKYRTPLYLTQVCKASCKIRNKQSEIS